MPAYVIRYYQWVEHGNNYAGSSDYEKLTQFCENKQEFEDWMDSTEHMRQASYKGRPMRLISITSYEELFNIDCSTANAESACRVDKKERAEKKAKLLAEREALDKQINEL
jgi:hypothetical protein